MAVTIEQQRALALARARLRAQGGASAQPAESRPSNLDFLNQGIAAGLGFTVDTMANLVNIGVYGLNAAGLNVPYATKPFGGSRDINETMNQLGVTAADPDIAPETLPEFVMSGIGGAAGGLGPFVRGATLAQSLPGALGASGRAVSEQFTRTPARAIASELAAGAGAGTGMSVANELAPDNPIAQVAGALVGGGVAGLGPNVIANNATRLPGVGMATRGVQAAVAPFTEAGALVRARNRVGGLVENPEAARAALAQENIGNLSPATQTGERRLMALEQEVRRTDPVADALMRQREADTNRIFASEIGAIGQGGNVADTRQFLSQRVNNLVQQMDDRVRQATEAAERRLAGLQPSQRQSSASVIAREELERSLATARAQEDALWRAIPQDVEVPTQQSYAAYNNYLSSLSRAQMDTLPTKVQTFFGEGSNQRFGEFETVKEMHGLYSELRKASRQARAAGELNTARIADGIADAIIEDIGANAAAAAGSAGRAMRDAIDFSRQLNETYRRGSIGRVLGSAREGGQSLPDELTLDATVGRSGTRGAVNLAELRAATGDSPVVEGAVRDYILSDLSSSAIRGGQMNPRAVENYLVRNNELLSNVPSLNQQIAQALGANQQATRVAGTMDTRRSAVQQQSRAGQFLNSQPGREIANLYQAENPGQAAAQLVRQARNDPTGQALAGLRSAFVDDVISAAMSRQFDEAGTQILSGNAARGHLSNPDVQAVAREILTDTQNNRLGRIVSAMQRGDMARSNLPDVGPVMSDVPNNVISLIARTIAARQGARAGAGASGASLLTANFASRRMEAILDRLTNNRAEQMIRRAILGDRELFDSLLATANEIKPSQINRIAEFVMGTTGAMIAAGGEDG